MVKKILEDVFLTFGPNVFFFFVTHLGHTKKPILFLPKIRKNRAPDVTQTK